MGKFTFPLPGRRQKPAPSPPPPLVGPLSKAQKVLGTTQISVDSPSTLSPGSKWGWDSRSNSGISIAISETATSHTDVGDTGLGIVHEGEVANPSPRRELRWEDESEILPKSFNRQSTMADTTDAASLRRRQSSSTIASFYDKSKQPLSISQQTSNSAMAKGVPSKVHAMLDMDGTLSGSREKKKKPARLDLSSLLPKSISQRHLRPDVDRSHVLGPDMMTKSPSVMSMSPEMTVSPNKQRTELFPRKKKTKESLREVQPPQDTHQNTGRPSTSPNNHRPTKSTVNQLNLYNHYEQRFFAEVMAQGAGGPEEAESPPPGRMGTYSPTGGRISGKEPVPPLPSNLSRTPNNMAKQPAEISLSAALTPLSLVSPPTDSCSISSRHTRTSKASKRTDRSLTDLDLQKQSVLSLSSDSEDDGYEETSFNGSLAVPPTSDGQASPTSPRSAMSQRSGGNTVQDQGRAKPPKRTCFATSPQFLPIPESSSAPTVNPRMSSLNPNSTAKQSSLTVSRPDLRMSIASTSTSKTLVFGVSANDHPQGPKIISMMRKNSAPTQPTWLPGADNNDFESFPAPPGYRPHHRPSLASINSDHPTTPLSPTSVDFYLQSHHTSLAALDNGSIRSEKSQRSGNKAEGRRRGSSTSSLNDSGSGRFMAVTRQEEMLLAALRMKRARMREDIIAEFEEDMDRNEHSLDRHVTNDSSASSSRISRQSSASTMRTFETGTLTMRPQHHQQPQIRISAGSTDKKIEPAHIATVPTTAAPQVDDSTEDFDTRTTEPLADDLYDFIDFDTQSLALPLSKYAVRSESADRERSNSKSRSRSSSNPRSSSALGIRSANTIVSPTTRTVPTHRSIMNDIPSQILEEEPLAEEEEDNGIPRPDSPISPSSFPVPMAMTRKKQVRLSAVGNGQINIEAGWWNDSG